MCASRSAILTRDVLLMKRSRIRASQPPLTCTEIADSTTQPPTPSSSSRTHSWKEKSILSPPMHGTTRTRRSKPGGLNTACSWYACAFFITRSSTAGRFSLGSLNTMRLIVPSGCASSVTS